jgi:hypothetical protein
MAALVGACGILPLAVSYAPFWRGAATFSSLTARFQAGHGDSPGGPPIYLWIVVALYLLGSALLLRARRAAVSVAIGTMVPVWAWSAVLVRWNRVHAALLVWLLPISLVVMLIYSIG